MSAVRMRPRPPRMKLPDVPLLSRDEERSCFTRMNQLRTRAADLQARIERGEANPAMRERIEALAAEATSLRNRIFEANLRLVVAVAAKFASPSFPLDELVSECVPPLLRAVELYDVDRGNSFSTYATHTVRNTIGRALQRRSRLRKQQPTVDSEVLDKSLAASDQTGAVEAASRLAAKVMTPLPERTRMILAARFGLHEFPREHTYGEIGRMLGLSKERARVLAHRALEAVQETAFDRDLEPDGRTRADAVPFNA